MPRSPRSIALIALSLLLALAIGVWRFQGIPTERALTLYYLDPQGMFLVPVTERHRLPSDPTRALQVSLEELFSHTPKGLMAPAPEGTKAEVKGIKDHLAIVDLKLGPDAPGSGTEQLMAGAVVRTAGSLDVHEVMLSLFDAKGSPLESQHLDLSQPLSPTDPGMENLYLDEDSQGLAVTVYYRVPRTPYLVPLRVPLPRTWESEPFKGSFALLRAGPPQKLRGILDPSLDPKTDLRWTGIEDATVRILWKNAPEATPSSEAIRALVLTLTETGRIKAVRLEREGPPLGGKVGPFDLSRPIPRPEAVNPLDHGA